ncbi:MAG: gluconolactonase [Cyclobacteriaceae bacterium]|nr:MAG: gluconolactonase [Cyclobacteriaceae bacterium]
MSAQISCRPFSLVLGIFLFWTVTSLAQSPVIANGSVLTKAGSGYSFTEGPAVDKMGNVFFTDQPNDRIYKWSAADGSVSLFMEGAKRSNGMYFDQAGNLVSCADLQNQLVRINKDQDIEVILNGYRGQRLNGPNDLWIHPKGQIYITDAYYKREWWEHEEKEIPEENVYCFFPSNKKIFIAAEGLVRPNGIVGTPNGKMLYVADIEDNKVYSYKVDKAMGTLSDQTLFAEAKSDGMTIDHKGNVYVTNSDGVTIFNKKGKQIEQIPTGERWTANVVFGGKERNILFITAMGSVYTLDMKVKGVQ